MSTWHGWCRLRLEDDLFPPPSSLLLCTASGNGVLVCTGEQSTISETILCVLYYKEGGPSAQTPSRLRLLWSTSNAPHAYIRWITFRVRRRFADRR